MAVASLQAMAVRLCGENMFLLSERLLSLEQMELRIFLGFVRGC